MLKGPLFQVVGKLSRHIHTHINTAVVLFVLFILHIGVLSNTCFVGGGKMEEVIELKKKKFGIIDLELHCPVQ